MDSGADTTVMSESVADSIGLNKTGQKGVLFAYKEGVEVVQSKCRITFKDKRARSNVTFTIPVLITLGDQSNDVVLGMAGVFDYFNITFKKSKNKIIMKKAS